MNQNNVESPVNSSIDRRDVITAIVIGVGLGALTLAALSHGIPTVQVQVPEITPANYSGDLDGAIRAGGMALKSLTDWLA